MAKLEISWKNRAPDGTPRQVYATRRGRDWLFFVREKKFERWQPMTDPSLEDWMELLDGVRRRVGRRLLRPEDELRVLQLIKQHYPESDDHNK